MDPTKDWETMYRDQTRYVKDLEGKVNQYEDDWKTLRTDPVYKTAYDHIVKVANGESAAEKPKAEEKKADEVPAWAKPLLEDHDRRRKETFSKWLETVEGKEKEFAEKHPELREGNYFGKEGQINAFMARHGIDDWDKAARAILEPKYFVVQEEAPERPERKSRDTQAPVEGKVPKAAKPEPANYEQARNGAFSEYMERIGKS